jgi:hypothetical protein
VRKNLWPPMSLANMRQNGVRAVIAACEACGHKADVNVDALPETTSVPEAGRRLRCGACGGKRINTQPGTQRATLGAKSESARKCKGRRPHPPTSCPPRLCPRQRGRNPGPCSAGGNAASANCASGGAGRKDHRRSNVGFFTLSQFRQRPDE